MLGSLSEADDAVQEAWLRLSRTGADGIENLGGWLTTVVARVCLDMLRSRTWRREERRADRVAVPPNGSEVRGASAVAKGALAGARGAGIAQPALVNGAVGIVVAPRGKLSLVITFEVKDGKVVEIEVIADPARLRELDLAVLND